MAATEITFDNRPRTVPPHTVYLKSSWTSDWVEEPHLHCDYCQFTANPDMARAQFTWLYGNILRPGDTAFEVVERLDHLRSFVKVEFTEPAPEEEEGGEPDTPAPIIWYGILEEDNGEQKGILASTEDGHGRGHQVLIAYGLDIMLHRHVLRRSVAIGPEGTEITIQRAIEFNAKAQIDGPDKVETGNRSADPTEGGTFVFSNDLTTSQFWSTFNAVDYLLTHHAPADEVDDIVVEWGLAIDGLGSLPTFDKPRKACHGHTLRQVLDELMDRRRLVGYSLDVAVGEGSGGTDMIVVRPFTFTPEDVSFEDDTIRANPAQFSLVFDADTAVQTAFVRKATLEMVDQVICTGGRIVACFSMAGSALAGENFVKHWTDDQQSQYDTAASESDGYDDLDLWEQEQRNKMCRAGEHLKRVYSYFGLPTTWDGTNNEGDIVFEDRDNPGVTLPFYLPQIRFLSHLPLKTDHDYRENNIADLEVPDNTPTGQKWEYRPPFVAILLPNTDPDRYQALNALALNTEFPQPSLETADGFKFSASVRMQDDAPGIVLTISGQEQHIIASEDFTPLEADDADMATFDWNAITATVAMEIDKFVEGRWPDAPVASQVVRRLVIDLGDEYKQHWVTANTVVAIDPDTGDFRKTTGGGFIRDDSSKLQALARLVYEWYHVERQSLELQLAYISGALKVGDLITTIGQGDSLQTINSVITGVKYEFPMQELSEKPPTAKTTFTTQFAELDAKKFVGHG